jgi:hypothetical protein
LNRVAAVFIHVIDAPRNDPFTHRFSPPGVEASGSRISHLPARLAR